MQWSAGERRADINRITGERIAAIYVPHSLPQKDRHVDVSILFDRSASARVMSLPEAVQYCPSHPT